MTLSDIRDRVRRLQGLGLLDEAAAILHRAVAEHSHDDELAELQGMLGGVRRSQGRLVDAIAAYDAGAAHETPDSSYNELNRLVTRVMLDPAVLYGRGPFVGPHDVAPTDVAASLTRLLVRLDHAVEAGHGGDVWVIGDLAVVSALVGDTARTTAALDRLAAVAPPDSVLAKYRHTFSQLAALDTPRRSVLAGARDHLERLIPPGRR